MHDIQKCCTVTDNENQYRLLIITPEFPPDAGGIGNHAYNLACSLSAKGFKITVLADRLDRKQLQEPLPFTLKSVYRKKIGLTTYFERITKVVSLCVKNDVVICSGKFSLWLILILRLLPGKRKFIAVLHGTELLLPNRVSANLVISACKKFDALIAVSAFTKSLLPLTLQSKYVSIINNGINYSEFDNLPKEDTYTPGTPLQLVTIGSVTERKGQKNVLEALPAIKARYQQVSYHVVGKPVLQAVLQQRSAALQVDDALRFYGMVERAKLLELLHHAHVAMMLSINTSSGDVEGFGIAVLEANACGKPVIGSRGTGLEDAIQDRITGRLVDPLNVSEVLAALEDITSRYSYYANNAKQWAKEHDWKLIADKYVSVINAV